MEAVQSDNLFLHSLLTHWSSFTEDIVHLISSLAIYHVENVFHMPTCSELASSVQRNCSLCVSVRIFRCPGHTFSCIVGLLNALKHWFTLMRRIIAHKPLVCSSKMQVTVGEEVYMRGNRKKLFVWAITSTCILRGQ